jgi:hypothetical protein
MREGTAHLLAVVDELVAFLNISLNAGNGWNWLSAFQLVGPSAAAR